MFVNGSTAIDGLSGRGSGFAGSVRCRTSGWRCWSRDAEYVHRISSIFLTFCGPRSSKSRVESAEHTRGSLRRYTVPGSARLSSRAAMFTRRPTGRHPHHHVANVNPDPEFAQWSSMSWFACASAFWTSTAHWTASTALGNSASTLSPPYSDPPAMFGDEPVYNFA